MTHFYAGLQTWYFDVLRFQKTIFRKHVTRLHQAGLLRSVLPVSRLRRLYFRVRFRISVELILAQEKKMKNTNFENNWMGTFNEMRNKNLFFAEMRWQSTFRWTWLDFSFNEWRSLYIYFPLFTAKFYYLRIHPCAFFNFYSITFSVC